MPVRRPGGTPRGPGLFGRTTELAELAGSFAAARAGSAQVVVVRGQAGSGKTALLGYAGIAESPDNVVVRRVSCHETDRETDYAAVRRLLGSDQNFPEPSDTYLFSRALYRHARDLTAGSVLVLAVDDVHWCDESSLRWFEFLLRRADELPVLIVFAEHAGSSPLLAGRLADMVPFGRARVIEPGPLGEAEIAALAESKLGHCASAEFTAACAEVSAGNPQFLVRLLESLRGEETRLSGLGGARITEAGKVIARVRARDHLSRQPGHVRQVARAVAVAGHTDLELVAMLSRIPTEVVGDVLDTLRRAMTTGDEGKSYGGVLFSTVLDELTADEQAGLRRRMARLLNAAGRPAGQIADQLLMLPAPDEPWMRGLLNEAAAKARDAGRTGAATRYLRLLVETDPEDAEARLALANVLVEVDPVETRELLKQALPRMTDPRDRAEAVVLLGGIALVVPGARLPLRALRGALSALNAAERDEPRPAADLDLRMRLESLLLFVRPVASTRVDGQADGSPWSKYGDTPGERQALATRALLTMMRGSSATEAAGYARRALEGEQVSGGWSSVAASAVLFLADEFGEAMIGISKAVVESEDRHAAWSQMLALGTKAWILASAGEITEAANQSSAAMEIADRKPWGPMATLPKVVHALVLFNQGEGERATAVLDLIRGSTVTPTGTLDTYYYLLAESAVRWARRDYEAALSHAVRCGELLAEAGISNPVFAPWRLHAASLLATLGRSAEAGVLVEESYELAARWGTARAAGIALMTSGVTTSGPRGVAALAEAVELLEGSPARSDHARAEALLGVALLRADDAAGARKHLRRSVDLSVRHGGWASAMVARNLLVAAGGRMRRVSGEGIDVLTAGERRVAAIAATGAGNQEIAEALSVTLRTVEVHLTSVYRKLGVSRRGDLSSLFEPNRPEWKAEP